MTETFRALRVHKTDAAPEVRFEDLTLADLMDGRSEEHTSELQSQ